MRESTPVVQGRNNEGLSQGCGHEGGEQAPECGDEVEPTGLCVCVLLSLSFSLEGS